MKTAYVLFLLVFLLASCGSANQDSHKTKDDGSDLVSGEMAAVLKERSPLTFEYEVKNVMDKEVTLEFSSSQRYDFSVETETGEQIYLFSSVAMFMAALGEELIKPGETLHYDIDLHELDLKPGDYHLKVWMTPKEGKAYEVIKEFSIE